MLNKDPFAVIYAKRVIKKETQEQYFRRAKRTQVFCALAIVIWIIFITVVAL